MRIVKLFFILMILPSFSLNDEVVIKFEKILKEHFESYKINPREKVTKLGGGWVKENYSLFGDYNYDIQVTNSLISPYTAYCEFTLTRSYTDFHNTKEEAEKDNTFIQSDKRLHKHFYSYKKEEWIITKRQSKRNRDWHDCNEVISEGENKGKANIHGCFEQ